MERWPFLSERGVLTPISLHAILIIIRCLREARACGPFNAERQLRGPYRPPRSCARLRHRCRLLAPRAARHLVRTRTGRADGLRLLRSAPGWRWDIQVSCCLKRRHAPLFVVDARSASLMHHSGVYSQVWQARAHPTTCVPAERGWSRLRRISPRRRLTGMPHVNRAPFRSPVT